MHQTGRPSHRWRAMKALLHLPKSTTTPRVGMIQPLPGVSYLATSPTYYEMMARLNKTKKKGPIKSTRRLITENRICSNIMSYN
jgi:hypothetical protein